jgi:hypothetical protein
MSQLIQPKFTAQQLGIDDKWIVSTILTAIRSVGVPQRRRILTNLSPSRMWMTGVSVYTYLIKDGVPSLSYLAEFGRPRTPKTVRLDDSRWPDCRPDEKSWDKMYEATYRELPSALEFCSRSHLAAIQKSLTRKGAAAAKAAPTLKLDDLF